MDWSPLWTTFNTLVTGGVALGVALKVQDVLHRNTWEREQTKLLADKAEEMMQIILNDTLAQDHKASFQLLIQAYTYFPAAAESAQQRMMHGTKFHESVTEGQTLNDFTDQQHKHIAGIKAETGALVSSVLKSVNLYDKETIEQLVASTFYDEDPPDEA